MGFEDKMAKRSYFEEIQELDSTWKLVKSHELVINPPVLAEFFSGNAFCIGSGGSVAIAKLWQLTFEEFHLGMAKTVTPYEFIHMDRMPDTVFLFSASGKNHDILQVFKLAAKSGCKIIIFTVTANSALVRIAKSHPERAVVIYPKVVTPKDGFLAVNSIAAMASMVEHVAEELLGKRKIGDSPITLACMDHQKNLNLINDLSHIPTIQIIASEWGIPAGHDLETRLAESGVSTCFLTDPRNFAHGRFIWLESYRDSIMVLFGTPRSKSYLQRFIKNLPQHIISYYILAPYEGVDGAAYCLTRSMLLFSELARVKAIDPGKPEVPEWGRKLHSLQLGTKDIEKKAKRERSKWADYPALEMTFNGIVSDIDGTLIETENRYNVITPEIGNELNRLLHAGMSMAFATGRGKSALKLLRDIISEEYWQQVIVGLYNGTRLLKLHENLEAKQAPEWGTSFYIPSIIKDICNRFPKVKFETRATQITVTEINDRYRVLIEQELARELGQKARFVKFVHSGHSLDIIPHWGSKLNVLEHMTLSTDRKILCIGDQGQLGGNDEELLSWQPSVSVGRDRPVSNACFWLGKNEKLREEKGMLKLLNTIEPVGSTFKINHELLEL